MPDKDSGRQLAQSLDRALTILESFNSRRPELGVQELSRMLEASPSTVSRLLAALESRGYVTQDSVTERFRLGVRALELGYRFADTSELMTRAAPHVDALAQQLKLKAELYGLDGGQLIRFMSVNYPPGQTMIGGFRFYPHNSAAGRVLLTALSPLELEKVISMVGTTLGGANPEEAAEAIRAEIDATRRRGYGIYDEETGLGRRHLGAPVSDASGNVVAALSVSGPSSRLTDEQIPAVLEVLFDRAHELSKAFGYRPHQALCEPG